MKLIEKYELIDSQYHDFDADALAVFETVKRIIAAKLPEVTIEHTGSTAIGIGGKNIIDALVICESGDFTNELHQLETLGFQISPFAGIPNERPLRVGSIIYRNKRYLLHVHLTRRGSEDHWRILFFRDYLRQHREAAAVYEQMKHDAIEAGRIDATEYNDEKAPFILSILEKMQE